MEPFLGQIMLVGFNFAPRGWAFCNGQLLPISTYSALFSLLGTEFGGDGRTTFGLPDLRGRVAVGMGQGNGLSNYRIGQMGGAEAVTLTAGELPPHSHTFAVSGDAAGRNPGDVIAAAGITNNGPASTVMNMSSIGQTGSGQSHQNMQPFTSMNYIIALEGVFPSRS